METAKVAARPRVLVIEDDEMVGQALIAMLEEEFAARVVPDSATAIAILGSGEPVGAVMLDASISGAVADLLAAADAGKLPVVVISGDTRARDRYPGRVFLAKPFTAETLLQVLRGLLGASP
jgi:DNA-binding response OmpR family regulator